MPDGKTKDAAGIVTKVNDYTRDIPVANFSLMDSTIIKSITVYIAESVY